MMSNTDRTKPLCNNKAQKGMAIVNKQRYKSSTEQQMYTDSKFMHMNNINITMLIFFVRISDKYGLLELCIKYIRLMKVI